MLRARQLVSIDHPQYNEKTKKDNRKSYESNMIFEKSCSKHPVAECEYVIACTKRMRFHYSMSEWTYKQKEKKVKRWYHQLWFYPL